MSQVVLAPDREKIKRTIEAGLALVIFDFMIRLRHSQETNTLDPELFKKVIEEWATVLTKDIEETLNESN